MGFGGISPLSLLLIFLIIIVLFGTKKIRSIGEDLGHAFKSFKKGLQNEDDKEKIDDTHEKK
ncbi:MAG TPA: twin-arginine translocase TatA/TatE family subunit [Candidatus Azoamicus sp. OHIO1]